VREKQKAKRYWRERCDDLARHEDELEAKDIKISLLKTKLLAVTKNDATNRTLLASSHADDQPSSTTHPYSVPPHLPELVPTPHDSQAQIST